MLTKNGNNNNMIAFWNVWHLNLFASCIQFERLNIIFSSVFVSIALCFESSNCELYSMGILSRRERNFVNLMMYINVVVTISSIDSYLTHCLMNLTMNRRLIIHCLFLSHRCKFSIWRTCWLDQLISNANNSIGLS